jgi:hypothetical protein
MTTDLATWIWLAGWGQLSLLIAAAVAAVRLRWHETLATLPRLHRQMYWIYAGYIALAIAGWSMISLCFASDLAEGSALARGICAYIALFWGIRLLLQTVLDAKPYLTTWWLKAGYCGITLLFIGFTIVFFLGATRIGQ